MKIIKKIKPKYLFLIIIFSLIFYLITAFLAFDSIILDFKPAISKLPEGTEIIIDKNKKINFKYVLEDSKEKPVFFAGDQFTLFPFIIKFKVASRNKAYTFYQNVYYFWFFGYYYQFATSEFDNLFDWFDWLFK